VSTQTRFDLDGLSSAIESGDCSYQLALYADHADVTIIDAEHPGNPSQVLHGKAAIRQWLDGLGSREVRHRVVEPRAQAARVHFVEECAYPDGRELRYDCDADVCRGQIVHESVIVAPLLEHAWSEASARRDVAPPLMTDEDAAASRVHPPVPRAGSGDPVTTRSLPGNFLG
jgi:hypothetical protein